MEYTIAAIPTLYNGRRFRSRLEARWAAFFDLCDWNYEYEPSDLGRWSPDFELWGNDRGRSLLVEVKPITELDDETARKINLAALEVGLSKFMLIGSGPRSLGWFLHMGWLGKPSYNGGVWDKAYIGRTCADRIDIAGPLPRGRSPIWNDIIAHDPPQQAGRLWAEAANLVQWHPTRVA